MAAIANSMRQVEGTAPEAVPHTAHVLFIIDELCRKGGGESALLSMVRSLPDRFRSSVITFRIDPTLSMLQDFPCAVRLLPLRRTYDWNAVKAGIRLAKLIHDENVDIVHTFFASADLWGGAIAMLARRPILVSSRRDMGFLRTAKHRHAYRRLGPAYDKVLTVSDQVRDFCIEEDGLDPAKVKTIYNAVDMRRIDARSESTAADERERFGLGAASHVIVSISNLRRIKGLDILIRTAALVCAEFPKAQFLIAGGVDPRESRCLEELQQLIGELGLAGNVSFLGTIEDVIPLLRASDAFCLLSRSEGFSNALIEAMACGIPSVATRVGGNAEALQDAETGFLVANEDYQAAATRVCELLRDPMNAKRMGSRARTYAAIHFTQQIVTSQLVETYDELLRDHMERRARQR